MIRKCWLIVALTIAGACAGRGALIAGWNFNSQTTGTAPTPISTDYGSGSLDLSGLNSSADGKIDGSGSSLNEVGSDVAGNALSFVGGTSEVENGRSISVSLSTSGYQNIVLTYATERSTTGFNSQQWSYSTDGTHYTSFGSAIVPTTSSYAVATVDFTSATSVNNDSTVYFELTLNGATGSSGSDHFDNIQFNADLSPVPEPAAWGEISGAGLLALCGGRVWRQYRHGEKLKS